MIKTEMGTDFGSRVRELRLRGEITQKDVAQRSGISAPYINQIERGARPVPSRRVVNALAAALGVSASELLPNQETPRPSRKAPLHSEAVCTLVRLLDEMTRERDYWRLKAQETNTP